MDKLTTRSMPVVPASYDASARTVRVVVASDAPVQVMDWDRGVITEILIMEGMTLPDGRTQVPLLNCHTRFDVEAVLGSVRGFVAEGGKMIGLCAFTSAEEGAQAEIRVKEGHLTDLSAGYFADEAVWIPENQRAMVAGREYEGPCKVTTKWTLKEVSLTPVGADTQTTVRSTATAKQIEEEVNRRVNALVDKNKTPQGGTAMPDEKKDAETPSMDEVRKEATRAEGERRNEIDAVAEVWSASAELKARAINENWTPAQFGKEAMKARKSEPVKVIQEETPVVTVNELDAPWRKRTVALLNVITARGLGSARTQDHERHLAELNKSIGQRGLAQEQKDAEEIVKSAKGISKLQQIRTLSIVGGGSTGEYTLPAPFLAELFVIIEQNGVGRKLFRPITMPNKTLDLATISSKPSATWATEAANTTASDPAFGTGTLTAGKLVCISSWSSELEEDSAFALLPVLQELMAEAIFTKEDLAGFKGDGTGTYGSFTGILAAATAGVQMDGGDTAFSNLTANYLKSVRDSLTLAKRIGAQWFMHPDIVSLCEGLTDMQGRYIFRGPGENRPALLWGYPIANSDGVEACPAASATAVSTRFVGFGNPKWMLMGQRRGLDMYVSRDGVLDNGTDISFNALQADGAILRTTERIAFKAPLGAAFAYLKTAAA